MKTLKKYILTAAVLSLAVLTGCQDKMRELNSDPGVVSDTDPRYIFYYATRSFYAPFSLGTGGDQPWQPGKGNIANNVRAAHAFAQYSRDYNISNTYAESTSILTSSPWNSNLLEQYTVQAGLGLNSIIEYIDLLPVEEQGAYAEMRAISLMLQTLLAWRNFDVYGANVWSQAYQAIDGITQPEYDLYSDVYADLDRVIKEQVAILNAPAPADNIPLGEFDPFYGVYVSAVSDNGGATISAQSDATLARERWVKFGNSLRLRMAFRLKNRMPDYFRTVYNEVTNAANGGLISSREESTICHHFDEFLNDTNDLNQINYYASASLSFINSLKVVADPRLPILARAMPRDTTFFYGTNFGTHSSGRYSYAIFKDFDQDALKEILGRYGERYNFFEGVSHSPLAAQRTIQAYGPGKLLGSNQPNYSNVVLPNPNGTGEYYVPGITSPVPFYTDGDGVEDRTRLNVPNLIMASKTQGRFWIKGGDASYGYWDYPNFTGTKNNIRLTTEILTFPEVAFTLALVALDPEYGGTAYGQSAQYWYEEGIRANMRQLNEDAKRCAIPIATESSYPLLVGINGTTVDDKVKYQITEDMIDTYIQNLGTLSNVTGNAVEDVAVQAWFAMYQSPYDFWGSFWKTTGYPSMHHIEVYQGETQPSAALPTVPGMELPIGVDEQPMKIARRATLPQPETLNNANYQAALTALKSQTNPAYGTLEGDNTGRIWWDTGSDYRTKAWGTYPTYLWGPILDFVQ